MSSVYHINKGINKPILFKGLKAQYIAYLAIGLVLMLIGFAVLYICGLSLWIILPVIFGTGGVLCFTVFRLSHKYGEHGLMKHIAKKQLLPLSEVSVEALIHSFNAKINMATAIDIEKILPLSKVENGVILSAYGDMTIAYEVRLPEIFTLSDRDYEAYPPGFCQSDKSTCRSTAFFIRWTALPKQCMWQTLKRPGVVSFRAAVNASLMSGPI